MAFYDTSWFRPRKRVSSLWETDIINRHFKTCFYGADGKTLSAIKNAAVQSKEILTSLCLGGFKLNISDDDHDRAKSRVSVNTKVFDDKTIENPEQIFCGEVIHEGAHALYSDDSVLQHLPKEGHVPNFCRAFESKRVDDLISTERPGYADFVSKYEDYTYKVTDCKETDIPGCLEHFVHKPSDLDQLPVDDVMKERFKKLSESFVSLDNTNSSVHNAKLCSEFLHKVMQEIKKSIDSRGGSRTSTPDSRESDFTEGKTTRMLENLYENLKNAKPSSGSESFRKGRVERKSKSINGGRTAWSDSATIQEIEGELEKYEGDLKLSKPLFVEYASKVDKREYLMFIPKLSHWLVSLKRS